MNNETYNPIIAEVRRNRKDILAEFGGDCGKLRAHLKSLRPEIEAAGLHYETAEERKARFAWHDKQEEELARKIASV
jgi:hypothetical protein